MPDSFIRKTYKSRAARRSVNREDALCNAVFNTVDTAKNADERELRLRESVFGSETYRRLPKFRRSYVAGYADGAAEMRARMLGEIIDRPAPEPRVRVPQWVERLQPGATWRRHPLGGGWVSHTAYVESTAYVGPSVVVFDRARVLQNARLQGEGTRVFGDAEVWEAAQALGGALIHGEAQLAGRCRVVGIELEHGRVDGTTQMTKQRDVQILTARLPARTSTVLPPAPPGWELPRGASN